MERVQIKRQIPCIATKFMQSSEKKQRTHTHTSVQSPFETLTIQHALYQSHLSWRVNIFYCCFCFCWSRCVCFFVLLVAGLLFVIWRVHKPLLECVSKRKSDCKKNSIRGLTPHLPFKWQLYFYGFAHSFFCCCFLFDHKLINNNKKKSHTFFLSFYVCCHLVHFYHSDCRFNEKLFKIVMKAKRRMKTEIHNNNTHCYSCLTNSEQGMRKLE